MIPGLLAFQTVAIFYLLWRESINRRAIANLVGTCLVTHERVNRLTQKASAVAVEVDTLEMQR